MPTAYTETQNVSGNYEYYLKLIINEINECLNLSGISYSEENQVPQRNSDSVKIIFTENSESNIIPADTRGIYIFFTPGNPESKRLATILSKNLGNIYYDSVDVKMISENINENNENSEIPTVTIGLGFENNDEDIKWIRENTENIAKSVVMSLSEYFGLPFVSCKKTNIGMTNNDITLRQRPSETSQITDSLPANTKVKIVSQWEDWYLIGENGNLGYVQTKYITV